MSRRLEAAHRGGSPGLRDPDIRLPPPGRFMRRMEQRNEPGGQSQIACVVSGVDVLATLPS